MMQHSTFIPYPALANRHVQTLLPLVLSPGAHAPFYPQTVELPDGDFLDLAWLQPPRDNDTRPLLILFHGLEGSIHSAYARRMMQAAAGQDWQAVLMHFRGCSGRLNRLARTYHSGETGDARYLIRQLHRRFPQAPLMAVGYSLGGNMLLKLCAEHAREMPLAAAVSVCAPLKLEECANQMQRGLSRLYQRHLLRSLQRKVLAKFEQYDYQQLIGLRRDQVRRLNSFWAFDDAFTAPVHGFEDARDYYRRCSAYSYIKAVETPSLVLQARDDPFMTEAVIPEPAQLGPGVTLELSETGGHVGFVGHRRGRPRFWLEQRIVGFLRERLHRSRVAHARAEVADVT